MTSVGGLPLGGLFIGAVSRWIGAPNALLCQGSMGILITAVFTRFLLSRRMERE